MQDQTSQRAAWKDNTKSAGNYLLHRYRESGCAAAWLHLLTGNAQYGSLQARSCLQVSNMQNDNIAHDISMRYVTETRQECHPTRSVHLKHTRLGQS
jgi:hypothetical protein